MKLSSQNMGSRTAQKELAIATNKRMNFADQFNTFTAQITINAGDEGTIVNKLRSPSGSRIIPGSWHVIDSAGAGSGSLGRSSKRWTKQHLYLTNHSADNGTFLIRFFEKNVDE